MSQDRVVRECIEQLSATHLKDKVMLMFGNVTDIQNDSAGVPAYCTVQPISENSTTPITDVALQADISDGEIKVPVIGSTVIVGYSIRNTPFVAFVSDIESYYFWGAKWQQGDGTYGGWVRGDILIQKINNLENLLNNLITIFNQHTHVVSAAPGTSNPPLPIESGTITPTQQSEISNPNATHGNL